jgi:plastocyanin
VLAAVVLSATVFTACGDDDTATEAAQTSTTAGPTTTAAPKPIIVKDFTFLNLEVKAGTRLLVQNEGPANHTLTAEDGRFDTGQIAAGANVQFVVPSTPGTYKVKCTIHPTRMTGELKVT